MAKAAAPQAKDGRKSLYKPISMRRRWLQASMPAKLASDGAAKTVVFLTSFLTSELAAKAFRPLR